MLIPGIIASSMLGAPTEPVAGYTLWLDATDAATITSSGGDVSQWSDKSANARAFTQSTATAKPKTGTRTINGLNTIDFDGTNDFMTDVNSKSFYNFIHNGNSATMFVVGIVDNVAATLAFFDNSGGGSANVGFHSYYNSSEQNGFSVVNGNNGDPSIAVYTDYYTAGSAFYMVHKIKATGTSGDRYKTSLNGAAYTGNNQYNRVPSQGNATYDLTMGVFQTGGFMDGCLGEVLMYNTGLSQTDIESNQSYLANKWGL